jgi:hypothetical protein
MGLLHRLQTTVTGMQGRIQTVDTRIHAYPNGEEIRKYALFHDVF